MAAQILSFSAAREREPASRDWSRQELAEFYRVESALLQAGLALEGDRGLSDEGDPWFVFCRADTGEVFIHFARVDGVYVVDGAAFGAPARGRDFGALVRDLIASHPLATVRRPGSNVMLHPAALLIALVGAAFFHSGKAHAAEPGQADATGTAPAAPERRGLVFNVGGPAPAADNGGGRAVALDAAEVAAVLTGVAIGLRDAGAAAAADDAHQATAGAGFGTVAPRDAAARADAAAAPGGAAALGALGALNALTASDAHAALTVMAVFHDLAANAAPASATVATTATTTAVVSDAPAPLAAAAAPATPAAPASETGPATLLVHLASGPLPQIEALSLVTADGALARVAPDHVVHVDQLPTFLADLIDHGDGAASSDPSVTVSSGSGGDGAGGAAPAADTAAPVPAPAADASAGHGADALAAAHGAHATPATGGTVSAPAPEAGGSTGLIAPTVPPPEAADPATPAQATGGDSAPVSTPLSAAAHDAEITTAVLTFVNEVTDVQVVVSGHDVVFYDPAIMQPSGGLLDSVTWRLDDGSSVSLVGYASELHAFHGLG